MGNEQLRGDCAKRGPLMDLPSLPFPSLLRPDEYLGSESGVIEPRTE